MRASNRSLKHKSQTQVQGLLKSLSPKHLPSQQFQLHHPSIYERNLEKDIP